MKSAHVAVAFLVLASAVPAQIDPSAQWGMYGHDPRHTGRSEAVGPVTMPLLIWRRQIPQAVNSCVTIDNLGYVFAAGADGIVVGYTPFGDPWWSIDLRISMFSPFTLVEGEQGYLAGAGNLICLTIHGSELWRYVNRQLSFVAPININYHGFVNLGNQAGGVVTILPGPPQAYLAWHAPTAGPVYASPAIGTDDAVYIVDFAGMIFCYTPAGIERWRYNVGAPIQASPMVTVNDRLYVAAYDGYLYAFERMGELLWRAYVGGAARHHPALSEDGTVYVVTFGGLLSSVGSNGVVNWSRSLDGFVRGPIVVDAGANVYVGTEGGSIYSYSPTGALRWRYRTQAPVLTSGIVMDRAGNIFFVDAQRYLTKIGGNPLWRLSGYITLEDYYNTTNGLPCEIELRNVVSGQTELFTIVWLDSAGYYSIDAPFAGEYYLYVKVNNWLSRGIRLSLGTNYSNLNFTLPNGDVSRNDMIDDEDLTLGLLSYGWFDWNADLDGDGWVTDADLTLIIVNFGQVGERLR